MGSIGVAKLVAWGFVVAMPLVVACTSAEEEPAETGAVPAAAPPLQPPVAETATVTPTQTPATLTAVPPTASSSPEAPPDGFSRLVNEQVGYSLVYPSEWSVVDHGEVASGVFEGANCQTVRVVDKSFGGLGAMADRRAFVRICGRRVTDGLTLEEFMERLPNDLRADYRVEELNGTTVYQYTDVDLNTRVRLQTDMYRIEIFSAVPTLPEKIHDRFAETQAIIESLRLHR